MTAQENRARASAVTARQSHGIMITPEEISDRPHSIILHLDGYLDTYNSTYFKREIEGLIAQGFIDLLFDLKALDYVSSMGVGNFTHFLRTVKPLHGDISISRVRPRVYEVFELLGLSRFFKFTDSVEEALQYTSSPAHPLVFPVIESCPICGTKLKLSKEGRFRCPGCKTILVVNAAAELVIG